MGTLLLPCRIAGEADAPAGGRARWSAGQNFLARPFSHDADTATAFTRC